ncbi:Transcription initiation factor TFIID subunit 13 [Kluyveromyces marxianus]|nr:Transcription initiation factor TFIID subunit 13 [Kluyveromyces marxianus]KAG0685902.1 Transcription initiation factor TFIID subunit 13 [Kluyveromyces marxianus]
MSRRIRKTSLFSKDVASLMYAFGDVAQPLPETVQCIDELVVSYLSDICANAYFSAHTVKRNKIKVEDFRFVLRKDAVKLGRAEELIRMNKVITDARKQFDNSEGKSLKRVKDDGDDDHDHDNDHDHDQDHDHDHMSGDDEEESSMAEAMRVSRPVGRPRKKKTETNKKQRTS